MVDMVVFSSKFIKEGATATINVNKTSTPF
jgi:hypothetical protein